MAIKVAINGFGRIGRLVFRVMAERDNIEVVAINDLADAKSLAMLLKYDSVHGRFCGTVEAREKALVVKGKTISILSEKDPAKLPWKSMQVDFAVESTGVFTKRADCAKHIEAGAKKVLLSAPAKDPVDATIVMGVNEDMLKPEHLVISNASCTTNCLAPMAQVINDTVGIKRGFMTTIHAYTNDQRVTDMIHKDLRRARAAAVNTIPTSTGAAKAIGLVIPALNKKMDGFALRVPTITGSVVDLVCETDKAADPVAMNAAFKAAAEGALKGVMEYTEDPIVSTDVIHNPHSCIVDSGYTMVINGTLLKTVAWYDNEWGYSNRMVDLIEKAAAM